MSVSELDRRTRLNPHAERLSLAEFRDLARGHYGTKTILFDAELANGVLEEFNTGNRRVNQRKLSQLVQQISSGEFENTGEPLILSSEGILNNGQHRLFAVIAADAVVDMDVRFGIPRRAFTKTDTGTARNPSDVLTIKGVAHGGDIARAVRMLILYRRGLPDSIRSFVSNDEVSRAYDQWKGIAEVADRVAGHALPRAIRGAALLATAFLASRSPGKARLDAWLEVLATGLDAGRDDPAYVARERILRATEAPVGTRELLLERFALLIRSWNAFAAEQSVTARDLRWKSGGRAAEPFPAVQGARLPPVPEPMQAPDSGKAAARTAAAG